jgi:hypothetical protein
MKIGKITRRRVGRTINITSDDMLSDSDDYALIADIILLLAGKQYMSTKRAQDILKDAEKILPYITELKLL